MAASDQIEGLYIVIDKLMDKVILMEKQIEHLNKLTASLTIQNKELVDQHAAYDKKYEAVENFISVCSEQLPSLLFNNNLSEIQVQQISYDSINMDHL